MTELAVRSATAATATRRTSGYRRLILAHVAVGVLVFAVHPIATVFGLVVLAQALRVALVGRRVDDSFMMIAYLAGCEVFWRMTGARLPWEFSKYLAVLVALSTLIRLAPRPRVGLAVTYLALLLPGCAIAVTAMDLGAAREALVSNVLGPITLAAVAGLAFSVTLTREAVSRILWSAILATLPMATYMLLMLVSVKNLTFTDEANAAASGNFGPNQVAASLSFALLAMMLLVVVVGEVRYRMVIIGLGGWFVVASFLTFSRGGLLSFALAAAVAAALMTADVRRFLVTIVVVALGALLLFGLIFPRLDAFTGGQLSRRYTDSTTSHRSSIAEGDLRLFLGAPLLGVGVGRSPDLREAGDAQGRQSHVEFTRLLAEHGAFGIAAMGALVAMAIAAVRRGIGQAGRAWSAACLVWSLVTMGHSDMRVAAIPVAFGLACLRWGPDARPDRAGLHVAEAESAAGSWTATRRK